MIFSKPDAYKIGHLKNNPRVAMNFNTKDKAGEEHLIVLVGDASFDPDVSPTHKVPVYFEKYKLGFDELKLTPERFSNEYSVAIRIKPTQVSGWE